MAKIYQVRFTVAGNTVAHEHYTETGAKKDAKALSKLMGNAVVGEIDVADDGLQSMVRVWEFTGGESGKPIKRDGAPSAVEVVKTVEDTRLAEGKVEKKPKAPRLTDEEKIAKIKAEAEEKLQQIAAGTYVLPVKGRKPSTDGETRARKPKAEVDRVAKLVAELGCTEDSARILAGAQMNAGGRRMRSSLTVVEAGGPIMASEVAKTLNSTGKESREITTDDVMGDIHHLNFLFSRENQSWRVTIQPREGDDFRLNLVPIKIEYQDDDEETTDASDGEAAA